MEKHYSRRQATFLSVVPSWFSAFLITSPKFKYFVGTCKGNFTSCLLKHQSTELKYRSTEYNIPSVAFYKDNEQNSAKPYNKLMCGCVLTRSQSVIKA